MSGKKVDIEPHRVEVEAWTNAGQSCEQVAAALRAQGVEVSAKTVSRYRVKWGLRKRQEPATKGRKYPNRKRSSTGPTKTQRSDVRKADITARTERGETAEQIAAALEAQGDHLAKGASTIWRLQTLWGLVPYDNARARGKHSDAEKAKRAARAVTPKAKRGPRRPKENAAPANPSELQHYPTECSFGPQRRPLAPRPTAQFSNDLNGALGPSPGSGYFPAIESSGDNMGGPPVDVAASLMSAEFLVDLAASTLTAANRVKDLYAAQQQQQPLPGMASIPTDEDIAAAKRKVREAAAVLHDLALPNAN